MSTTTAAQSPAVPAGYVIERGRGAVVVALPSVMAAVVSAIATHGTLARAAAAAGAQAFAGRGAVHRFAHPDGDWVVRHYRRGGAVARVLTDTYVRAPLQRTRPVRELSASVAARARGVATPEVIAAVVYPAGAVYRADLATRLVADSVDLAELSFAQSYGEQERVAGWHAAGELLAHAFAAGVEHADLNLRNVIVQHPRGAAFDERGASTDERGASTDPARTTAWLLDLDRAVVRDHAVSDVVRSRMLERLHRSRRKLESSFGARISAAELDAFSDALSRDVTRGDHG